MEMLPLEYVLGLVIFQPLVLPLPRISLLAQDADVVLPFRENRHGQALPARVQDTDYWPLYHTVIRRDHLDSSDDMVLADKIFLFITIILIHTKKIASPRS